MIHVSVEIKQRHVVGGLLKSSMYGRRLLCLQDLIAQGLLGLHCAQRVSYYQAALYAVNKADVLAGLEGASTRPLCALQGHWRGRPWRPWQMSALW